MDSVMKKPIRDTTNDTKAMASTMNTLVIPLYYSRLCKEIYRPSRS